MEKGKKILLVHDTRGLGVAAAAETKTQLELKGAQVDTYASFLETGLPANFFTNTIDHIPIDEYDEVIILNIALNQKNIRSSLEKIGVLGSKLHEQGKSLIYLDTHGKTKEVDDLIQNTRTHCGMILRSHSLDADLLKSQSRKMLIGAISDRDSDTRVLDQLNERDEKIALGLDIASRGDFQTLWDSIASENQEAAIAQKTSIFLRELWDDKETSPELQKTVETFANRCVQTRQKTSDIPLPRRVQNLILEMFSEHFVKRAVRELQAENYEWFLRLAEEREPKLPELEWTLAVGNVTIAPLADPNTSWTFKLLDQAVQKHKTQFGISIIREAEDQRQSEEPADIITIIKNWRMPDSVKITGLLEKHIGPDWKKQLNVMEIRGREGNVTLRLQPGTLDKMTIVKIQSALSDQFPLKIDEAEDAITTPEQTVQTLIAEKLGTEILRASRGRENNRTLRLPWKKDENINIFCTLLRTFGGTEIDKNWLEPLGKVIKIYASLLTQASRDIREATKKYLGKEYIDMAKNFSGKFTKAAISLLANFLEELQRENKEETFKNISDKLARLNEDVEITKNLIRVISKNDVSSLDLEKIKAIKIKKLRLSELSREQQEEIIAIVREQIKKGAFPEGDDEKLKKIIETEGDKYEIVMVKSGEKIDVFYTMLFDQKTGRYHPDWLMANPQASIKGLAEAAILKEFGGSENWDKPYGAEVKPSVKTTHITIDKDGFIAYGDTQGDPDFKDRYLRIARDKTAYDYLGKKLSTRDEQEISTLCQDVRIPYKFRESMEAIKIKLPEDNTFILDTMKQKTGKQIMSRLIQDMRNADTYYCVFEPANPSHQALAKVVGEDHGNHPPKPDAG